MTDSTVAPSRPSRRERHFAQTSAEGRRSGVDQYKARDRREPRQDTTHALIVEAWALGLLAENRQQDCIDVTDEELRTMARVAGETAANNGLYVLTEYLQSSIYQKGGDGEYIRKGRWAADVLFRMGIRSR